MEHDLGAYWLIIVLAAMPWLSGYYGQKRLNAQRSNFDRFNGKSRWLWLLGLRPNQDQVHKGLAIIQVWGIVMFVTGCIAIYFWGELGLKLVVYVVYLGGICIIAILGAVARVLSAK